MLCQASALSSINKTVFYCVCCVFLSYIMLYAFKFCMEPFFFIDTNIMLPALGTEVVTVL
jgi:hypothetical protein